MIASFDIFLSYPGGSPEDSQNVRRLGELFEFHSLQTWIAERDRQRFGEGAKVTQEAQAGAPVFVACLGTRRAGSWGQQEIKRAAERSAEDQRNLVLTVFLPGADPEDFKSLPREFRDGPVLDMRQGVTSVAPLMPLLWGRLDPERAVLLAQILKACRSGSPAVTLVGPPGCGKTALAHVAMEHLKDDYPDGHAFLTIERGRDAPSAAGLAMGYLSMGERGAARGARIAAYQRRLAEGRYLLVFDEVEDEEFGQLVPPAPSTALFVTGRRLRFAGRHHVIEVPPLHSGTARIAMRESPRAQPGYASDTPEGADLLEIQDSVDALCSVIAARDVKPPLSVGLFGEWGAGKTFFVEKMRSRIDALSQASRDADASSYCASVRQIEFNAWHYADVNLWASLASRVFQGLAEKEGEVSNEIIESLPSSRAQLEDAEAAVSFAKRRVEQAQGEEERTHEGLLELEEDGAGPTLEIADDAAAKQALLADLQTALHRDVGTGETLEVADNLLTTWGALHELWRLGKTFMVAGLILGAVAVASTFLFPHWYAVALPAVAAVVTLAGILAGPARWVIGASEIAKERAAESRRKQEKESRQREERLRREMRLAEERREQAQRQVDEAELAIEEIKSGRRLFSFIDERSRADAYKPYFGVVSVVRQDFEDLAAQMKRHADHADGVLQIDRIVLYIDDLDRCPSDRVVQVLEAVHLLMASELFVVVVAVDPRWLLRSLERHHSDGLAPEGASRWAPTPHDYLEKIFQIPFGLPRMGEPGYRRLIESLIPVGNADPVRPSPLEPREDREPSMQGELSSLPVEMDQPPAAPPISLAPIDLQPEGLRVLPVELEFMSRLGGMLKTPRAAKRLTNLYRLVRVSLPPQRLDALVGQGDTPPGFRCVQLLLAIAVGSPALSTPLLTDILDAGAAAWWPWIDGWDPPKDQAATWRALREGMAPIRLEPFPDLPEFARWVPDVIRYSYDASPLISRPPPRA